MANSINIELVLNGPKQTRELNVTAHVNKYLETFLYSKYIQTGACKLDYYENDRINADKNLFIFDKSFLNDTNKKELALFKNKFNKNQTNIIATNYKDILITNVITNNVEGEEVPLFYKHELPPGTTEVDFEIVTNSNEEVSGSYKVDLERNAIYTNYENEFDLETGRYRLYFIISSTSTGESIKSLLNPVNSVRAISWEDIDLDTGQPFPGITVYTTEENTSGYTFRMIGDGPWYWKPTKTSTLYLMPPSGQNSKDNWNLRVNNGNLKTISNNTYQKYWIPEFAQQPFNPFVPYVFSTFRTMYYVNRKALSFTRDCVAIFPEKLMHLEVLVYDENDLLIEVHTTDYTKKDTFWQDTDVKYTTESIDTWDNQSGIVVFSENLESRYTYYGNYFYESKEYEIKEISLNPLQNKGAKDYMWVFYCVPNCNYYEKAIHYLGVDKEGIIRFCSQTRSQGMPNFTLKNADGTFNENTILGKKYLAEFITDDCFINKYSNMVPNDFQYLILGEVFVLERELKENSFFVDVREKNRSLKKEKLSNIFKRNHRVLQSKYGYGEDGQEYAKNNCLIYEIPITVLLDYGGIFSKKEVENKLRTIAPSSKKILINYTYKEPVVTFDTITEKQINFNLSWEGSNLIYNIYRREKEEEDFKLIHSEENPTSNFSFLDSSLESKIYHYSFSIIENNIEYPKTNFLSIRVK